MLSELNQTSIDHGVYLKIKFYSSVRRFRESMLLMIFVSHILPDEQHKKSYCEMGALKIAILTISIVVISIFWDVYLESQLGS